MIVNPRIGQVVRVHYRKGVRERMPWQGEHGAVAIRGKGPGPRNHGILIGSTLVVVPCGNISPIRDEIKVRGDVVDAGTF